MRLATGLRPDPLGHYSAPPDSVAVIRGVEGGKGKETVVNRNERKGMEGKTMEGREM